MNIATRHFTISHLCAVLLALLFFGGCAVRQADMQSTSPTHAPGTFVLPGGVTLSDARFMELAGDADYILIGERHDNPTDHIAQAKVLRLLAEAGWSPVLGLEMLPRNRFDAILASFSKGGISLEALPEKLEWKQVWGFDFSLYRPVFVEAQKRRIPVFGLNISNKARQAVSRKNLSGLSPAERKALPGKIIPPLAEQRVRLAEVFHLHSKTMYQGQQTETSQARAAFARAEADSGAAPIAVSALNNKAFAVETPPKSWQERFDRFVLIQSLWDSTMAEQAVLLRTQTAKCYSGSLPLRCPFVILAGTGHVEYGYGIAHRLALLDPNARILSLMPVSHDDPEADAAHIFYYSPIHARSDGLFPNQK